jgi:hypothetical protein
MTTTTKTTKKPAATTRNALPAVRTPPAPLPRIEGPPITREEAAAAIVVIEPEEDTDLGAMFALWNEEDAQGDPEEQQRSFDLLMRYLEEDRG